MRLSPGRRVGCYEILAPLGAGGMGEVYRARDTKLHREVALKVLPESLVDDRDRLSRFAREAHLLASLNHPGIAQIHGVEDSGDVHALVLELVEGETLAERIEQGPISVSETLSIARQIASALAVAHEAGIIHRDLKPANVKVTPDGAVKLLDFGLAKGAVDAGHAAADGPVLANSPTITNPGATQAGVILGTAAYMSPEQAKGRPVDRRADIWAVGVVFFEMLTGRRAFEGDDVQELLAQILTKEPDWPTLPSDTPATIRKLIGRCLIKDRRQRLDSAKAVELEIDEVLSGRDRVPGPAPTHRSWMLPALVGALLVGALASGIAKWSLTRPRRDVSIQPARFTIVPPPEHRPMLSQYLRSLAI